jgi:hypothetical protein
MSRLPQLVLAQFPFNLSCLLFCRHFRLKSAENSVRLSQRSQTGRVDQDSSTLVWSESHHQISLERGSRCSPNCNQITGTVRWTFLLASNGTILDCRDTARPSRPAWWNLQRRTSSGRSWFQNSGDFGQFAVWIIPFDSWETVCCVINNVVAFAWILWIQIVPFALGAAPVDRRLTPKTERACKLYVAILVCCPTWWLASFCN